MNAKCLQLTLIIMYRYHTKLVFKLNYNSIKVDTLKYGYQKDVVRSV